MGLAPRGALGPVDVGGVLRDEAAAAVAAQARQGARFKIAPKRRGYESVAADAEAVAAALARALGGDEGGGGEGGGDGGRLVVEHLLDLARREGAG